MQHGDIFPAPLPRRGAQTGTIAPVWFAFTTPPQQESPAQAWLTKQGVEAWFPTETAWRIMARGKKRKVEYQRRVAPGYIFARFTGWPQWDVLKASRHISGVIGHGDRPVVIPEAAIAAMAQVPSRIADRRAAAFLAAQINPGDRAEITSGAMVDWIVNVVEVNNGVARFMLGGMAIDVDMARLVKRA